jgi:methyl-accepting chemotaxis protein
MKWFVNMPTSRKLALAFGVMLVLLVIVIVTAYRGITTVQLIHDVYYKIQINLCELRAHQNFNRGQMLEMILTVDKFAQKIIEQKIKEDALKIDEIAYNLSKLKTQDSKFQSRIIELKNIIASYRQVREQEISLIQQGNVQGARQLGIGIQDERFIRIRDIALELGNKANEDLDTQLALQQQAAVWSINLFVIIGIFSLLVCVSMVILFHFFMARPLSSISNVAARIASGDLSANVSADERSDELGVMMQAFHQMVESLRHTIAAIKEGITLLGSSASEILASTIQVASGTAETATAINETTATIEEVRQAAQLSSEKAKNVSDKAQRVAQVSQGGQKSVEETAFEMEQIREQMGLIAQTITRLSEQSQSIGGIIASVTDLADQSNLLAVNAAIEASRAGEQGKGFVVVAQEIKVLAEQSKQATAQVRGILSDIQKATSAAVMATEQGSKLVDAGVKQAAQAGEAIRVLAESSGEAAQSSAQIVASSQQQVMGMNQINIAMQNINQAGEQTATGMKQVELATQNLQELGEKLKGMVEQFKR